VQKTAPANTTDTSDEHVARLVELAKPSTSVLEGVLEDCDSNNTTEPVHAPNVARFMPTVLVQYLAWQQACELTKLQSKKPRKQVEQVAALLKDSCGRVFEVTKQRPAVIGRKVHLFRPDVDAGDNKLVSKRHAVVQFLGDGLTLRALGKNAILVDGTSIQQNGVASLRNGSVLQLAGFKIEVEISDSLCTLATTLT